MLFIRVALVLVIRVGLDISGNRLQLNNKLMNSVVGVCSAYFNKSLLKSPAQIIELFCDLNISVKYLLNSSLKSSLEFSKLLSGVLYITEIIILPSDMLKK